MSKTKITAAFLALALIPFAIFTSQPTAQPAAEQEKSIALQLENEGKKQLESQINGMQLNEKQGAIENLNQIKQPARKPKATAVPSTKPQANKPIPSTTPTLTKADNEEKNTGETPEAFEEAGEMGIQEFDELNEINNFDWSFEDIDFGE